MASPRLSLSGEEFVVHFGRQRALLVDGWIHRGMAWFWFVGLACSTVWFLHPFQLFGFHATAAFCG